MRKTIDENMIVPIPESGHICADKRVYVVLEKKYYPSLKYNVDTKLWLGRAVSDAEMHPNDEYKRRYPEEIQKITHVNLPEYHKRVGLYAVALAIGINTGIYQDLITNTGPENANLAMDYATYSIAAKSDAAKDFDVEMSGRMLFLGRPYSDSWIGDKIRDEITDDQVQAFKNAWIKEFTPESLKEVWICIDGSNDDCAADIDEAEPGHAKSKKSVNIISFMYAVTQDGTPVTSQIYRGSRVDSKALIAMVTVLNDYGITPKGCILDRGFCDESCISLILSMHFEYVIKIKENTNAYQVLLEKYRDKLRFGWSYALGQGLYGVCENTKIFKTKDLTANCALIWDARNGELRTDYLVDGVLDAIADAEEAIAEGKEPKIPVKYSHYLQVKTEKDKEGKECRKIEVAEELLQKDMLEKGYYGLACSMEKTAKEANSIYDLRDSSEKQYSILKSQLGGDTFRAHTMHGVRVREMFAFTASVIRNEILKACKAARPRLDTNKVIKELDFITMDLTSSGQYIVLNHQSKRQKQILSMFGVTEQHLQNIASYETKRRRGEICSPIQTLESTAQKSENKKETRRVEKISADSKAKGKGARSGKSSDKAAAKEVQLQSLSKAAVTPSDPVDSRSSPAEGPEKKAVSEKQENKNLVLPKSEEQNAEGSPKRGRGRPKGSRNKPKELKVEEKPKRKRGRPKGSRNKPKQASGENVKK